MEIYYTYERLYTSFFYREKAIIIGSQLIVIIIDGEGDVGWASFMPFSAR